MADLGEKKSEFRDMDQKYSDGVSHEESQVSEIKKTCTDCGTSKTLLWIGGPVSPKTGEEISNKFLHGGHLASKINLDGSSMAQTQYIKDVFYHAHTKAIGISDGSQSCKMKILCRFGGKILPRRSDGKLRYVGGEMHIISIPKNLSWKELVNKMTGICNQPHTIKYQLPGENLDSLITISSDEDLQHMIEEYRGLERQAWCQRLKIFLILASETENQYLFDTSTIQRGSPDYEYIISMNSIWDPSHMENSNEQLVVSELNVSNCNSDQSPSFHEDLPFFLHQLEMKDNSSVPHLTQEKMSSSFPPKVVGPLTSTMAKEGHIDIREPNVQNHLIRIESMVPHREVDLLRPLYSKCCYQDSESTDIATNGMRQLTKENVDKYSHVIQSSYNSNPLISFVLNKVFSMDSQLHQGIHKENRLTLAAHNQHDPFVIEDKDEYSHVMQSSYDSNPLIIFMLNKVLSIDSQLRQGIHKENRFTPTAHNQHDPFVVEDVTNCLPSDKEKLQISTEEEGNGSTNTDFDVETETYGKNANYQTNDAMDDEIEADICVLQTKDFWREAQILSKLHHPNVLSFYGVVPNEARRTSAIVTEYVVDGSLGNILMKKDRTLDFHQKLFITMDAAFGMEYLHSQNIVHFDVKCDNLLVDLRDPQRPICKVGDLGLSRIKKNSFISGGGRGTLPWMAPELLDGSNSKVSEKVDVFSFGITMWEILTDEEPYDDMDCGEIIGGVLKDNLRPPVPKHCDKKWKKLMEQCWSSNPHARPSFTEIAARLKFMVATLQFHGHQYQNSVKWLVEAPEHEWSNGTLSCVVP